MRRAAFDVLVSVYWRPVYARLRIQWRSQPADAEDLAQDFFARAIERSFFDSYDPERARFRTFLRHLPGSVRRQRLARSAPAETRRGSQCLVDITQAERELALSQADSTEVDADEWFDREWVRSLFGLGGGGAPARASRGTTEGGPLPAVLERHDLEPVSDEERPSYLDLADGARDPGHPGDQPSRLGSPGAPALGAGAGPTAVRKRRGVQGRGRDRSSVDGRGDELPTRRSAPATGAARARAPRAGGTRSASWWGREAWAPCTARTTASLDRDVALKVLARRPRRRQAAARLEREAQILARLEHPGIVPVHDAGMLADGRVFYVMKLVRGERLEEARTGAPIAEALRLFLRVCETVGFAHAHGVVHRDLKPSNIMVGPFGEVLVLDWGIARVRRSPDDGRSR